MKTLVLLLALSACAAPGTLAQIPASVDCKGKSTLSMVGGANAFQGVNGYVSFDCGDGAYIHFGQPTAAPAPTLVVQP